MIGLLTKIDPSSKEVDEHAKLSFALKWKHDLEKIAGQNPKKDDDKKAEQGTTIKETPRYEEINTGATGAM